MLDDERTDETVTETATESPAQPAGESADAPPAPRKRARSTTKKAAPRKKAAAAPAASEVEPADQPLPVEDAAEAPVKPARKRAPRKKAAAEPAVEAAAVEAPAVEAPAVEAPEAEPAAEKPAARKRAPRKSAAKKAASADVETPLESPAEPAPEVAPADEVPTEAPVRKPRKRSAATRSKATAEETAPESATEPLFQAPSAADVPAEAEDETEQTEQTAETAETADAVAGSAAPETTGADTADARDEDADDDTDDDTGDDTEDGDGSGGRRRRRRRGGRRRRKGGGGDGSQDSDASPDDTGAAESGDEPATSAKTDESDKAESQDGGGADGDEQGSGVTSKRRRRRRRSGDADAGGDGANDGDGQTVTRVRRSRSPEDEITSVSGSTRLEAKKQRRREGREAGRRRAPIVSEAEFLARRESVDRTMVVRQRDDLTQIAVLEDGVMVEHYVARESQTSLIGNVYLGRVQNVLPSMEAAFVDIGKGRNAVIYAGEVNWAALGHVEGQPRKIESVLSSGQSILVQVTKDPIGHKGARLTSQISLAGRFLVLVPDGTTSGISRKLPDTERARLKAKLKEIVPDGAGVIVRTAAEGATEEQLTHDVERLTSRWADIESASKGGKGGAPKLLYGEPDLTLKVVRDLFTEDFKELLIEGDGAWETIHDYVMSVAPDLEERLSRFEPGENGKDVFGVKRIDEQIAKGLDRKVWLPSGGSLIFDRTEAMTVVDVNTGKFTGSGGNLEETVTKNNLEAAEELVRQLRLRDIGGIIVVDFIDMVLESNRDLVLRRLVECLGRDRTRHQVAEVSSLGLVQMTRKRIGTGLLESFSETCQHCAGSGVSLSTMPVEVGSDGDDDRGRGRRRGGKGRNGGNGGNGGNGNGNGNGAQHGSDHGSARTEAAPKPSASPSYVAAVAKPENADRPPLDEQDAPAEEQAPVAVAPEEAPDATADPEPTDPSLVSEPAVTEPAVTEPAPVDTAPRTVTRTSRRRSAVRPAGSPAGAVAAVVVTTPDPSPSAAADPTPAVAEAAVPPPPTVVTRTRGRGGRRVPARGTETPQD